MESDKNREALKEILKAIRIAQAQLNLVCEMLVREFGEIEKVDPKPGCGAQHEYEVCPEIGCVQQ
jgi:hypothetical protein